MNRGNGSPLNNGNIQNRLNDAQNRLNSGNLANRPNFDGNRINNALNGPNRVTTNRIDSMGNRVSNSPLGNRFNNRIGNNTNVNIAASQRLWSPYRYNGWNRGYWNVGGPGLSRYGYGIGYGYGYGNYWGPYGYGAYGPWYGYGWYGRPWGRWAALGLTSWALGGSYYNTGYAGYYNPYYASGYGSVYNYSQPITYATTDMNGTAPPAGTSSNFQAAQDAFYAGDYNAALTSVDAAITETPNDPSLHEFRALTLFALQRYPEAASTLYAVLSVGPGMNWSSMIALYPSVDVYTQQLRNLEGYSRAHPNDASGHFLLGYQYLVGKHTEAAQNQFATTAQLAPKDQVAHQLSRMLAPPEPGDTTSDSKLPPAPEDIQNSLEKAPPTLKNPVGDFQAKAGGGGQIALKLAQDDTFTWTFTQKGQPQQFNGKYTLQGDTLALDFADGGGMVGTVKPEENGFHFAVVNGPQGDPGLDFARQ
ncbi:tetratricopeptide repeat protein [bacterium]|nr:tetratricopeptide repeat protein [bacterium]